MDEISDRGRKGGVLAWKLIELSYVRHFDVHDYVPVLVSEKGRLQNSCELSASR